MKTTVYLSAFVFAAAISLIGCGDPLLDDLNSNIEVGSGDLSIAENYEQAAGMFLTAQQKMHDVGASNGAHVYQVQFNIHIDNYSGYMAGTQNFSGNLPSTYRYFAQYCDGPKASFFNVAQAALPVMRSAADLNLREIGAMCNIMYCFSALELSDVYGPFPWTDYKNDVQEPPVTYEPMDQIYDSLFVNLKDAGKILKEFTSTSEEHQDTIVFTGGVGENQTITREAVCKPLAFMGVEIDPEINKQIHGTECVISTPASKVKVVVIPTDEEYMIASDTKAVLSGKMK